MHCPFTWLFRSQSLNNKTDGRHETALKLLIMTSHHFPKICLLTHSQYIVEILEILQWNYTNFYKGLFKDDVNTKIAFFGLFSPSCHNLSLFSLTLLPPCHRPKTNKLFFRKADYKNLIKNMCLKR